MVVLKGGGGGLLGAYQKHQYHEAISHVHPMTRKSASTVKNVYLEDIRNDRVVSWPKELESLGHVLSLIARRSSQQSNSSPRVSIFPPTPTVTVIGHELL